MDKETIIFLHIPKTGGRSLQNIISKKYTDEEIITDAHEKFGEIVEWSEERRRNIHYIQGHFIFGAHKMFPLIGEQNQSNMELYNYVKDNLARMIESEGAAFMNDVRRFKLMNRPYNEIFRLARTIKHKVVG